MYQDESVKEVFSPLPMIFCPSERKLSGYFIRASARKLSSYLVLLKLYPLERKRGSYKCANLRCLIVTTLKKLTLSKDRYK